MTGSLQLKRGIYHAVIYFKDQYGSFKTKWVSSGLKERGNKKEAKEFLVKEVAKHKRLMNSPNYNNNRRAQRNWLDKNDAFLPFQDYIRKYLESIKDRQSPAVYNSYKYLLVRFDRYFKENPVRLLDVMAEDIMKFYNYLKSEGLKSKTIKCFACLIRPALQEAYINKLVPDNQYQFVQSIRKESGVLHFYDEHNIKTLLKLIDEQIEEPPIRLAFKMAAVYGLRRSELLGLRWSAINFSEKSFIINHKVILVEKNREESPIYDKDFLEYVFLNEFGTLIKPDHLSKRFSKLLKENNLKHIRFHDLRHSCASIMLAKGMHMKQIQEWLGHAHYSTTVDN